MMISPETYVHFNLEGKSEEEANREIKKLRREMNQFKDLLECEKDRSEVKRMVPSLYALISCSRDYLYAAREYFESQGWEYKPSKIERSDKEFNDRLKDLESIKIEYFAFFNGVEIRTITFDNEKILTDRDLSCMSVSEDEKNRVFFKGMTKNDLLKKLAELHIGEWMKKPKLFILLDGILRWSIVFKYSDGKRRRFKGDDITPYNFDAFLDAVQMERLEDPEVNRRMFESFEKEILRNKP